ncbi:hypothetical protein BRAS3843_2960033 [Bradyrhizobium sp. STM 3843]|nr:hypothetical protein BRAS3843_2960033 [Bradyrhizobium sp. STM 3843]
MQGRPGCLGQTCGSCRLHFFRRRATGAASARPSLRPLAFKRVPSVKGSGALRGEVANGCRPDHAFIIVVQRNAL